MKLSDQTLAVLKNYSTINSGVLFKQGSVISTVSPTKTVLSQATLKDSFPQEFAIFDLNNFLSVYSLGKDSTELEFDDKHVIIKSLGGRSKIKYRFAAKDQIITPPDKTLKFPSEDFAFTLTAEDYDWIMNTARVLQSPNIAIEGDGSKFKLTSYDSSDDSAHVNSIEIGDTDKVFNLTFKTENLKMIPGAYDVRVSKQFISHFKHKTQDIEYWIAVEKKGSDVTNL